MRCGSEGYGLYEESNGIREENEVYHTEREKRENSYTSLKPETDYNFKFLISRIVKCMYNTKTRY
jgi:hypothetical protein